MSDGSFSVFVALACFVLFVAGSIALASRSRRRRAEAFARWAAHCGADVERITEFSSRFAVSVDGREIEVRDAHRGGGVGSESTGRQYLMIATKRRGRSWDLHSVEITARRGAPEPFEKRFKVREFGLPMRDGWLTPSIRSAIATSFSSSSLLQKMIIEGGELVFLLATIPEEPAAADALLAAHGALATQLERGR